MFWKILIAVLCVWCGIYTVSYGVFEYKCKNPAGAMAVIALGVLTAVATAGVVIFSM